MPEIALQAESDSNSFLPVAKRPKISYAIKAEERLARSKRNARRRSELTESAHLRHHFGLVLERYMSPLLLVNLLMRELGSAPVPEWEARDAVVTVVSHYTSLTQPHTQLSQDSSQQSQEQGQTRRRRRRRTMPETESALVASQATNASQHSPQTLNTDIQDALVLDVVKVLCEARDLSLTRVGFREMRTLGSRVTPSDLVVGTRAAIIADRRDPVLATVVAIPRGTLQKPGPPLLQMAAVPSFSEPWRRLVMSRTCTFPRSECVMAFIERVQTAQPGGGAASVDRGDTAEVMRSGTIDDDSFRRSDEQQRHGYEELLGEMIGTDQRRKRTSSPLSQSASTKRSGIKKRRGDVDEESKDSNDSVGKKFATPLASSAAAAADSDDCVSDKDLSDFALRPPRTIYGSRPIFSASDRLQEDPFLQIPRVDVRGGKRSRRRNWVERLLRGNSLSMGARYAEVEHH